MSLVSSLLRNGVPLLTVEDHAVRSGFGANVIEACNLAGLDASRVMRLGMPERWIRQGSRQQQHEEIGIDAKSIARSVRTMLDDAPAADRPEPGRTGHVASDDPVTNNC